MSFKPVAPLPQKKRSRGNEIDDETKKQMNIYMAQFLNNRSVLQIPKASGSYGADSADESSAEEDDEYDSETGARKRTVKRSKANEEMGGEGGDDEEDDEEEENEEDNKFINDESESSHYPSSDEESQSERRVDFSSEGEKNMEQALRNLGEEDVDSD